MIGQGRPDRSFAIAALLVLFCFEARVRADAVDSEALSGSVETSAVAAAQYVEDVDPRVAQPTMRLRLTFGGGRPRVWTGWITLSDGQFRRPQLLGLEPDEPGSMAIGVRVIQIRQPSSRSYDGLDIDVSAPLDAVLRVRLSATDTPGDKRDFQFTLSDLIDGVHPTAQQGAGALDELGNRIVVSRAPGDRLRVLYDREALVFAPEEVFRYAVAPHLLSVGGNQDLLLKTRITSRLSGREVFTREQGVKTNEGGAIDAIGPLEFTIPPGDDVYELTVSLSKPRLLDPLVPTNPLTSTQPILQRRLQFVAIDPSAGSTLSAMPRKLLVDELDPTSAEWGERMARLPLLKRVPRLQQGKLSHGKSAVAQHLGQQWIQLAPDAWQAHPLSVESPGAPHVIEVEYPSDIPQTLGISLIEPNSVGKIAPLGVDTAVQVDAPSAGVKPAVARHRLVFWPKTKTPIVLLTSHDSQRSAIYGKIRVQRRTLVPLANPAISDDEQQRLIAAWLDKPLLPEMFGATDAADRATARSLDDWRTFYEASTRFAQHLEYAGYNAAVVPAWCEGSALYPSNLLQPTPKYDTGVFLSEGQDPQRKDVLELLLRQFDRAGLTLMPSLQFNTPLPELEALRGGDPRTRVGLELIGRDGRTVIAQFGTQGGLGTYYNPLDLRVQAAMTAVVRELAARYGHHPSFGGVVIQLSPRGYAMLPGDAWGFDDRTFARFVADTGVEDPGAGANRLNERAAWCNAEGREAWLAWRARQLTALYSAMGAEVRRINPEAKLVLAGSEMLDGDTLRRALRPSLASQPTSESQIREALLEIGIDPQLLAADPGLALVAPQPEISAGGPVTSDDWDAAAVDLLHRQLGATGSLSFQAPITRRIASFDAASPFGQENTYTWLAAQVSRSGDAHRQRWIRCLTPTDRTMIFDGGWMLPRGQEDAVGDVAQSLAQLPPRSMTTAPLNPATQPVILRTATGENGTVVYLLNNSPWPVKARVNVQAQPQWRVRSLVGEGAVGKRESKIAWSVKLPPYGIVAGEFDQPGVKLQVDEVTLPGDLRPMLYEKVQDIRARSASLITLEPRDAVNMNFELPPDETGNINGWVHARGEGVDVALVDSGNDNSPRALRVVSRRPEVWVRSAPIDPPTTGRIAVWARLRMPEGNPQPRLRLAIEARVGPPGRRQPYYRFASVGAGVASAATGSNWARFILHIDDLPREEMDEFRIGFDLMGAGEVWIDDVEIFDASFTEKEQFQISRLIAAADYHLREENIAAAAQVLDGYWPRFLQEHVEPATADVAETPTRRPSPNNRDDRPQPPARQSFRDRARGWWPF